jgi:hypothetical protein
VLDPENPFIIKVPEGATELDLGPILRPLIFRILKGGLTDLAKIERFVLEGEQALSYRELLPKINSTMLIDYLNQNGWEQTDGNHVCLSFHRDYAAKKPSWDRHGPHVRVYLERQDTKYQLHRHDDAVKEIAEHERLSLYETARRIIASTNVLDRIVAELD